MDYEISDLGIEMVYVAPGTFQMGSDACEAYDSEKPVHEVQITQGFWVGKYEVTNGQYLQFLKESGYDGSEDAGEDYLKHFHGNADMPTNDEHPVVYVNWKNAVAFCEWLTKRERKAGRLPEGYEYRLPTEAEWEYAAQGGQQSKGYKFSGSDDGEEVAWNFDNHTHKVGQKEPNELGIYDMSGNVFEWCLDHWHDSYRGAPTDGSAWTRGGDTGRRVVRGGSWNSIIWWCRSANRLGIDPEYPDYKYGFRVVLSFSRPASSK